MKPEIRVYPDIDSLSRAAAEAVFEISKAAVARSGRFTLALAGGNTPMHLYELLASEFRDKMPWNSTHLFWGDERFIPKTSPESNFKMANDSMISRLFLPSQNIHPISTELESPEDSANTYEEHLREFFQLEKAEQKYPKFDLVLLGLGDDGHTASIFAGDSILNEKKKWVAAVNVPPKYKTKERITLTLPVINSAKNVFFIVACKGKTEIVNKILADTKSAKNQYPAAMVQPKGELVWFLDSDAAEGLEI